MLGRIWNLADTEQKGELGLTEFIIAMHLLTSYRNGSMRALPQMLPTGFYDAASRRGVSTRELPGSRPTSGVASVNSIPRQFSGAGFPAVSSSEIKPPYAVVNPQDKENYDQLFSKLDVPNLGFITGDQAVAFFSNSRLPADVLAQIWDLADINSEGRLNRDEFAVAMFLIREQRSNKDGKVPLPQILPPNLVPPSMRPQPGAPALFPVSVFDKTNNVTVSRSVSEDLYDLDDAFKVLPSQITSPTGESMLYKSSPSSSKASPQIIPMPQQAATGKRFVPTSSFGQTMLSPQSTRLSDNASTFESKKPAQKSPFAADDLLGDNDPDVSQKLTQETTELANLSNQVSTLTSHMHEVKSKRVSTEQDLSKAQAQKRDFEARLSQLRFAYDQEVVAVKTLEERLSSSRGEIKQLERDMALIDGTYQDLQNQHRQVAGALEVDQKENLRLKERIKQTNNEINELRPQIEKTKSELRHQKGLVTINKKQLSINETEREKLKGNLSETSKELHQTRQEIGESTRSLETKSDMSTPIPAASPPISSTNMNPFFRRAPTTSSEKEVGPPFAQQGLALPNHNAFDSFFGPPITSSTPEPGPPSTTLTADSPKNIHSSPSKLVESVQSVKSSDEPDITTPSDSTTPTDQDDSQSGVIPPPPPQSRQITSNLLPFRSLQRNDSTSSSVRVVPPASRLGDTPGFDIPTEGNLSSFEGPQQVETTLEFGNAKIKSAELDDLYLTRPALPSSGKKENLDYFFDDDVARYLAQKSPSSELPGSFPGDSTPPVPLKDVSSPAENSTGASSSRVDDLFGTVEEKTRTPMASKDDFSAAFEGFANNGKAPETSNGVSATGHGAPKAHDEFPPIQDVGADEESDSDYSGHDGFDDDFTAASPRRAAVGANNTSSPQELVEEKYITPLVNKNLLPQQPTEENYPAPPIVQTSSPQQSTNEKHLIPPRPSVVTNESNQSELPTPGAQVSPPTYDQAIPPNQHEDPNRFPAEYSGLLPSREVPVAFPGSPSDATSQKFGSSAMNEKSLDFSGGHVAVGALTSSSPPAPTSLAPGASAAPFAYDQTSVKANQTSFHPPVPPKTALNDDFDNEFGDLSEAREADDKGDDELNSAPKIGFDEFSPIFDSPNPSKSIGYPSSTFPVENDFRDFESTVAPSAQAPYSAQANNLPPSNSKYDWDAMFAGIETPQNNGVQAEPKPTQTSSPLAQGDISSASNPALPRVSTDRDDPILKRLTGMGYPRDSSLKALEKFDYNINMVRPASPLDW